MEVKEAVAFSPRSDGSTFATVVYESDLLYEYCAGGKSSGVQRMSKKRIKVVARHYYLLVGEDRPTFFNPRIVFMRVQ